MKEASLWWHCFCSTKALTLLLMGGVKGCKVKKIADTSGPSLLAVLIFFGSLFFLTGDQTPAFGEIQKAPAGIRVEDHRGFTRIVFPHEHPEKISVEPDLDRRRFIVRFPETTTEVTTPGVPENHHLISRIEILSETGKALLVEVVLANEFIDWVSYQYEDPPRKVLYLRTSVGSKRVMERRIGSLVSQPLANSGVGKPDSFLKMEVTNDPQSHNSLDLATSLRVIRESDPSRRVRAKSPKSPSQKKTKPSTPKKKPVSLAKVSTIKRDQAPTEKVRDARPKAPPRTPDRLFAQPEKPSDLVKAPPTSDITAEVGGLNPTEASPPVRAPDRSSRRKNRSDMVKDLGVAEGDKVAENLWRPSAEVIPEFIRVAAAYPPDFHEMKEDERTLYVQALERFREGDFSGAREMVSKIVPRDPVSLMAETLVFFKADCNFQKAAKERAGAQAHVAAIQTLREAMTQFPQSRFVPHAVLLMATGYRSINFFQEALVQYEIFLSDFPDHPAVPEALFWKGESLFQTARYREARVVFEEFVNRFPPFIHARIAGLRVGDCFYKMGDLKRARDEYGRVLSEPSDFSYYPLDSLFSAGQSFLKNQDFQRGREILFRALNLDPRSQKGKAIMEAIAQSYLAEDLDEEALRINLLLCENFSGDDPDRMELVRLADMRLSRPTLKWPPLFVEAYLDPVRVYQDFLDHTEDLNLTDEVMYRQALALVKRGDLRQAVANLRRILSQRHQDSLRQRSSSLLSYALNSSIQRDHGREKPLDVIQLYQENAAFLLGEENMDKGVLLVVAETFRNLGLLEDALVTYQHLEGAKGLAQDQVLFEIGRLFVLQGNKKAAREALESLSDDFPKSLYLSEAQKLLGDLALDMRDYPAATRWYRLALASHKGTPGMGRVYAHLGRSLKVRGRYKEAMDAYEKSIDALSPFSDQTWAKEILVESLAELATHYEVHGRIPEAVAYYGRILRLSPPEEKSNWALYRLGESYRKMGNVEMMKQTFARLKEGSPDSLWNKLATQAAGGATLEALVAPYLAEAGISPVARNGER